VNFFVFKVDGAAGRTLRFTFTGVPAEHWTAIRPVVGYAPSPGSDLGDPAFFEPDAKGKSRWEFMTSMEKLSDSDIVYTHHFERDAAYVALRVPYTLDYQQRYLASLPKQAGLEIIEIGKSAEGRPLTLIKIGRGDEQAEKNNPCILMYAREHCDEPDSSWAVQGAIRFLASSSSETQLLRKHFTFLFIPMLDPDGNAAALHTHIGDSFKEMDKQTHDSNVYARWFKQWIDAGNRLELVLNFHNPEPRRYANVFCPRIERGSERKLYGRAFLAAAFNQMSGLDVQMLSNPLSTGVSPGRLGHFLSMCYGPLHVPFEVNSQTPEHQLSTRGLFEVGQRLIFASTQFLSSGASAGLHRDIKKIRAARQGFVVVGGTENLAENALTAELRYQREDDESPDFGRADLGTDNSDMEPLSVGTKGSDAKLLNDQGKSSTPSVHR
jgi:hypothetical protein